MRGLLPLLVALLLLLGTHLTEAAAVSGGSVAAVDKDVAPVGVVKTDLLSLEQEIGGNPTEADQEAHRNVRSFLFGSGVGIGVGPAWIGGGYGGYGGYGSGYGWGYPGYGYYGSPYYGGYYPGYIGYKKIIIG